MAAPTISWVWPTQVPAAGGELRVCINQIAGSSPVVKIAGVTCTILGTYSGLHRVDVPAHAAGAVDVDYQDSNGSAPTLTNGLTYVSSLLRWYLVCLGATNSAIDLKRPNARQAALVGGLQGYDITNSSSVAKVLSPDVSTGTNAYAGSPTNAFDSVTTNGNFYGNFGYVIGKLKNVASIAAGTWTFAAAVKQFGTSYPAASCDKLCLYVWRPSNNTKVGTVYDGTVDYTHPAGTISGDTSIHWLNFTFSGSAVSGIQDGDILALEWYGTADATHQIAQYCYFNGANVPGTNGATTSYTSVAAYLEAPASLWALPNPTGVSPNSGGTGGGTSVTISGSGFTGATSVTFGGVAATGVAVVSDAEITCTTPAHAAGAVDVAVTTPNGTGTGTGIFTYTASSALPWVACVT